MRDARAARRLAVATAVCAALVIAHGGARRRW
jgi:hypothetical protein